MTDLFNQKLQLFQEQFPAWENAFSEKKIHGFGACDRALYPSFMPSSPEEYVQCFFDNAPHLWNQHFRGIPVHSPLELPRYHGKILVFPIAYQSIKQQLADAGKHEFIDFMWYSDFFSLYHFMHGRVFLPIVHIAVTTRCTLQCEACNMFMPDYDAPADIPLGRLTHDLDLLFSRVHYVQQLQILGGEPLLFKHLPDYITHVMRYKKQIGHIQITTNGTLIPSESLLNLCASADISFAVSNYTSAHIAHYEEKRLALQQIFKEHHIEASFAPPATWTEFSCTTGELQRLSPAALREHYLRCSPSFRGFGNGRFYPCHLSWSAANCGKIPEGSLDSLDFMSLDPTNKAHMRTILQYDMKYLPTTALALCAHCYGCDPLYQYPIQTIRQKHRNDAKHKQPSSPMDNI